MYLRFRLNALMKEKNISEGELATRAKVTRNTVRGIQRGTNKRIDLEVMSKIAGALGVRPIELLEETDQPPGPMSAVLANA